MSNPWHGGAGRPFRQQPRRLDNPFQGVQSNLSWADKADVSAHTLRHHAIASIERVSSWTFSQRFARHKPEDTNDRYSKASEGEVTQGVVGLHGGDHPWIHRPSTD